jgi:phage terminase small subunit
MSAPKRRRSRKFSPEPLVADLPDESELGPSMRALTLKARRFVLELARGPAGYGSEIRACKAAGYGVPTSSETYFKVQAHQLLHNDKIQAALKEVGGKMIRAAAFVSIRNTEQIANDFRHKDQLRACLALMDRGFPAETHHHLTVEHIDHDKEAVAQLRALKSLDVSRAKLEEVFGINGLTRYERLLAIEDNRRADRAKLIEGEVA